MKSIPSKLSAFYHHLNKITHLRMLEGMLDWDQQVMLPKEAGDFRADQMAFLAEAIHQNITDESFFQNLGELATHRNDLNPDDWVNIRETLYTLERERKIPKALVIEKAKVQAETYQRWVEARKKSSFKDVAPYLERLIDLLREEARCIVVSEDLYDALLDVYEPGARIQTIRPLLTDCARSVADLLPAIVSKTSTRDALNGSFPKAAQEALTKEVAAALGFSFAAGRLDTAPHPFQATVGPRDHRITTRWDETDFLPAFYGVIHEVGHALYEQGLPLKWFGTPRGSHISLGIHESQSRFWENIVGRSEAFSRYLHPLCKKHLGSNFSATEEALFYTANRANPTLIRVEADEVTYTSHIVIRMTLEEALISGDLLVKDLPGAWSDLYYQYLSIRPNNDAEGVLQDIHWYGGSVGYFPTYALGNLYGAMMTEKLRIDIPNFEAQISSGEFSAILGWMNQHVHTHGKTYRGPDLIHRITGEELTSAPFIEYIKRKFV